MIAAPSAVYTSNAIACENVDIVDENMRTDMFENVPSLQNIEQRFER